MITDEIIFRKSFSGFSQKRSDLFLICIILSPFACCLFSPIALYSEEAKESALRTDEDLRSLIRNVETQTRGNTSQGRTRMNISTREWKRSLLMETWSEGRDKFLVKITEPAKEKGTCTLKVLSDIWNFFPKIDRLVKIPSSLMGDKWMGSHFTNDDLVKDNKVDELYDLSKVGGDEKTIVVQAVPKPTAAVVWGKIVYTIEREKKIPLSVDYFDESGVKVRTMVFDQVKNISGRWVCMRMKVLPIETPEEYTEVIFETLEFDVKISETLFSVQSLRKL